MIRLPLQVPGPHGAAAGRGSRETAAAAAQDVRTGAGAAGFPAGAAAEAEPAAFPAEGAARAFLRAAEAASADACPAGVQAFRAAKGSGLRTSGTAPPGSVLQYLQIPDGSCKCSFPYR